MRILGIQIRIDYSWFLVFGLVLWSLAGSYLPQLFPDHPRSAVWAAGLAATVLFFASVLAHELSHSLVARALGVRVLGITLFLFGGVSQLASEAKDAWTEIKVAAAGPLTSFLLGGTFLGLSAVGGGLPGDAELAVEVLRYLSLVNFALGAFNLLPGFPLDGGRVLRAIWWLVTGSATRATRVATRCGIGLALLMIGFGVLQAAFGNFGGLWLVLLGLFLRSAAAGSGRDLEIRLQLEGARAADAMLGAPAGLAADLPLDRAVQEYFVGRGLEAFPVVREGEICGVLAFDGVRRVAAAERSGTTAASVMAPLDLGAAVGTETGLGAAMEAMARSGGGWVLVVDGGRVVGVITPGSLSRFLRIRPLLEEGAARQAGAGPG